ncbi:PfkB family carbohydrate kinase [Nibricoccus sp. IMCC34717]|uniref:PfkB family carbohydrate kinase n=1 Tax=Nibricoccus sp. IMCC34717 TaxID=3034021 RepID=UPI00384D0828
MDSAKVIPFADAAGKFEALRKSGRRVVLCHGTFDLIHPGHIVHFEEAKALGDLLVVTVTGEKFVNKGPGRPYFNDAMRARWLSALACVDHVVIVPHPSAVEAIDCVKPTLYCKGHEYADPKNDLNGKIQDEIEAVTRNGGEVHYVGSITYSSTKLLNELFDPYPAEVKQFCQQLSRSCNAQQFRKQVESFSKLKVLIIGDIIFDKYTTLEVQGLTSKNRILSGRWVGDEMQAGGALAVFRHIREFTKHVKLISLVGQEPWLEETLDHYLSPAERDLVSSPEFTTVVKQRFVEPRSEGKELTKLFSVNYINKAAPSEALQYALLERIADTIDNYDLVLVMDFGHGVMEDLVRVFVQQRAKFLAVNCQTNSNNHGFNILNRRYRRADAFTLDQTEMNLAVGRRDVDFGRELTGLAAQLGSRYAWLTRGATETLGRNCQKELCKVAPFERVVVDTLGAGDAFCAVAALAAAANLPLPLATFMGQLAGAQAVKIVGNSEPIRKNRFLKAGTTMLAF